MNLLELLTQKGVLDQKAAERAAATAKEGQQPLETILLDTIGVDPEVLLATLGEYYNLPTRLLPEQVSIPAEVLSYIPEDSARHYGLLPLALTDGVMEVGTADPDMLSALDALNFIAAQRTTPYRLVVILRRDLERGLELYENLEGEVDVALGELEGELETEIAAAKAGVTEEGGADEGGQQPAGQAGGDEHLKEDAPVTRIVATILRYAVDGRASDIHIEPVREKVIVRFRVDGVLSKALELPKRVHSATVARVKILTSMRLDERRKPQDGRFSATIDKRKIDFRVSTFPTYFGEKVVMRILDPEGGVHSLAETGISEHDLKLIKAAVKSPYGIILISGPTGSGKSTTLYSMLAEVDRAGKNVLSLEDPVEYNIEGVSQSQVRPEIGYTFASGLRSILRQDPDVIMVGEIRDKETAQLAIQAALTGHLVLSTIHTNNAIGVVPRLIDMGVDPYLIAPTLVLAIAQRLVQRICPDTGKEIPIEGTLKTLIEHELAEMPKVAQGRVPKADHVLEVEPTEGCPTGTRGRIAVMEVMQNTSELQSLILESASEDEIFSAARKNGFVTMKEDAIMKALNHDIPWSEVNTLGALTVFAEEEAKEEAVESGEAEQGTAPAATAETTTEQQATAEQKKVTAEVERDAAAVPEAVDKPTPPEASENV